MEIAGVGSAGRVVSVKPIWPGGRQHLAGTLFVAHLDRHPIQVGHQDRDLGEVLQAVQLLRVGVLPARSLAGRNDAVPRAPPRPARSRPSGSQSTGGGR